MSCKIKVGHASTEVWGGSWEDQWSFLWSRWVLDMKKAGNVGCCRVISYAQDCVLRSLPLSGRNWMPVDGYWSWTLYTM